MKKVIFTALLVFILLLSSCSLFYSIDSLPKGEFFAQYASPNNTYVLNIYRVDGDATVDCSLRGELVDTQKNTMKNIYWAYHESKVEVAWENDYTVKINNVVLDVRKDVFDYRRH